MDLLTKTHPAGIRAASPGTRSVAFLLSDRERNLFFGPAPIELPDSCEAFWVDCDQSQGEPAALKPSVVVTAWACGALDLILLPTVKYICHLSGSVRQLVPRAYIERGGLVSNWGNSISDTVAEHALLLVLACLRSLPKWKGVFGEPAHYTHHQQMLETRSLFGLRVGLHGFGGVGQNLARLLAPFQVSLSAFTEGIPQSLYDACGVERAKSLEALFRGCDVIVECEALNAFTRHTVDRHLLKILPDDSVFVNVGRGGVVDEQALLENATSGRLRIGLDVLENEPLAADSPFLGLSNVLISPHIAGPTRDRYRQCGQRGLKNISAFLEKRPIEGVVTLEAYDRST